ncbi:hypothetical protein [Erwinia sp. Leaf53]|uniref:hypothetical protein n=1 Tax=Erwinia sp. Leaf53 TaxID=1736225 RepID=UPI0006FEC38B|nr:hypothetical protein [Erwinia sp. Leaf53]KQN53223.1 hypothetical protein ASF13_16635 [Erwinia sp. Leaf53]
MGFPSPATDYIETRINLDDLMVAHPAATTIIREPGRILVIDRSVKINQGDTVAFELFGEGHIGKLMGESLITEEGEAIEGQALEDVVLLGCVTWIVLEVLERREPTI